MKPNPKINGGGVELDVVVGTAPPHSPDCEAIVISLVMIDSTPATFALCCMAGVKPKAFYLAGNQTIWKAIVDLHKRGVAIVDSAVVAEELSIRGELEKVGGYAGLAEVSGRCSTTLEARFFAEQLVLLWHLRRTLDLTSELREAALEFEGREAFVAKATDIGQRLLMLGKREVSKSLKDEISEIEEDVSARAEGRVDQTRWISSGLPLFDQRCKPFTGGREDQMVVFAGGSGMGKSVVLRQEGGAALLQGKRVLSFSRETSTAGFVEMLVASWTSFDLLNPELEREKLPAFRAKCEQMRTEWADKLLFCVQHTAATPLITVEDLVDQARAFVNLRGQPDVILVDYLQLFGTRKPRGSREETVATVSHTLQALAREMPGTTMFVAAQLNESGLDEMRQIRREQTSDGSEGKIIHRLPKPGDIRESQAIYFDADRVIFLYRPPIDCFGNDQRNPQVLKPEVWWFQEKRRRGGVGVVRCWFEKRYTRFVEVARPAADAADAADGSSAGSIPDGGAGKSKFRKQQGRDQ